MQPPTFDADRQVYNEDIMMFEFRNIEPNDSQQTSQKQPSTKQAPLPEIFHQTKVEQIAQRIAEKTIIAKSRKQ